MFKEIKKELADSAPVGLYCGVITIVFAAMVAFAIVVSI